MIDYNKIKLVIWDLDDTFWKGTLSEGPVSLIQDNVKLLKRLTDCGIINAICSKNDPVSVDSILRKNGLDYYFVFSSINWDNKGGRIKNMLNDMGLRDQNVLFIDDNIQNLKEAEYYNPNIMTALPSTIAEISSYFANHEAKDTEHKRLKQYKVLESKRISAQEYDNNEAFLVSCDIRVEILNDCEKQIERLHELVLRTNQLNFTKKRPSKEEFLLQLKQADQAGYVRVQDRFGDYGIVGFYLIKEAKLEHFLFSCRTIGQGIEQYIYEKLGQPSLSIVGDVTANLNGVSPYWIKEMTSTASCSGTPKFRTKTDNNVSILFKGPCDMQRMVEYLQLGDNITKEFSFINDQAHEIETHNHSAHISDLMDGDNGWRKLVDDCFFLEEDNFKTDIFKKKYDIIFLSTLIEGIYGRYRNKETGQIVAYGHYIYPLSNSENWIKYINREVVTYGYSIKEDDIKQFLLKYEFIGRTNPEEYVTYLKKLLMKLADTKICLILGSEIPYEANDDLAYNDRHIYHQKLNSCIREFAAHEKRLYLLEISSHIKKQNDFTNNINHYTPAVYYALSKEMITIINKITGGNNNIRRNRTRYLYNCYVAPLIIEIRSCFIFRIIIRACWAIKNRLKSILRKLP